MLFDVLAPLLLVCPPEAAGRRLDQALAQLLPQYSRSRLQGWIRAGQFAIDGVEERDIRRKLCGGEAFALTPAPEREARSSAPENIALDIVFADATLIVINKPAGLVVHPGNGNWSGTLMNALLHYDPALSQVPRAGIVHRLDKETSGLMVVARTLEAQTHLVRQLQARSVKREYLAVTVGEVAHGGSVDAPIGRHPKDRVKMAVARADSSSGKPAVTHYRVLQRFSGATLLACQLETGRTHQIRVHMAHIGYPLLGDPVYGRVAAKLPAFPRQALHATRLTLTHPANGELMQWEAPLPEDMKNLLEQLRCIRPPTNPSQERLPIIKPTPSGASRHLPRRGRH
ncbi:MAG: 23S rRNA pseudouridine(1911/1915/1917) synthase RluD [Zoogloeaceae bacterium]|nr:23S rRNA pseudouridine(1911/1915/1917) synthase RluD [Zoogloeaceae bacterium]